MRLEGRSAVVTGGAGGIGRAVVDRLVAEGAKVLAVDRDAERGAEIARAHGERAAFLEADLRDPGIGATVREAALDALGGVDALVNNAHASVQAPLLEHTDEMLALSMETGLHATWRLMVACHDLLARDAGAVVNFGSGAGLQGQPTQASYAAAKEAIRGLSRVAANEWAADGIRVNVVCPIAETEGVTAWAEQDPRRYERMVRTVPLGRLGDPATDIAPVVAFLCSDESAYITGQTIMADGGTIKLR